MNMPNSSHLGPDPGWQLLGELELPAGSSTNDPLRTWLTETLRPLSLHEELLRRIVISAQEATTRAFQKNAAIQVDHIHLLIYVPRAHDSRTGTWGFFRVARIENMKEGMTAPAHSIEFYLYIEGHEDHV